MEGWIKLHRKFVNWEWYKDANVMRLFVHCLLKANHQDNNWQGNMIKRGSFITSLDTLSHELGLSVKQIRTAISKLERTNEVAKKGQSKFTVIQVINYDDYQGEGKQEGTQKANKGQTKGKQRATNNNDKKEENEKEYYYIINDKLKLSMNEYDKLLKTYSPGMIDRFIFAVENYKGVNKYKNLYRVILTWIAKEERENAKELKKEEPKQEYKYIRDATF
jgi:hypothetical protein